MDSSPFSAAHNPHTPHPAFVDSRSAVADTPAGSQDNRVRLVVQQLLDMDRNLRLSIKKQQEAIRETRLADNVPDDLGRGRGRVCPAFCGGVM
ncbi:hypothetical protein E4U53_002088 [Claviceps sorghi]|nr:hypothetical protein E4U53_002088 [Claviceps sorghi]